MKKTIEMVLATVLAASPLFAEAPKFSVAGEVEFEANAQNVSGTWYHDYSSTFNLLFAIQFTDKWSAEAAISADGGGTARGFAYDGAFVQYLLSEKVAFKVGDFTYAEGAFRYYNYDDPADYAIGMVERGVRGFEVNAYGLVVGLGLGTDADDCSEEGCTTYDAHIAYDLALGEHTIRPFFNYKSYQTESHNSLRAGVTASLVFGSFGSAQLAYGLKSDYLTEDEPKMTHAFAVEPELNFGKVSLKATAFYAIIDDESATDLEVPEYMFFYVEPSFGITDKFALGIQGEYHTMALDSDASLAQIWAGPKVYYTATENLGFDAYVRACIPLGDDYEGDDKDVSVGAGASVAMSF